MPLTFDKEAHRYYLDGKPIPGFHEILDFFMPKEAIPNQEYYLKRGTAVHLATEFDDRGILDEGSVSGVVLPLFSQYRAFKRERRPIFKAIEEMFCHESGFATTIDRIMEIDGQETLVDIKTGGKYREHRLQTAAGIIAYGKMIPRACLYLSETGYELKYHEEKDDIDIWIGLVRAFHWLKPRYK